MRQRNDWMAQARRRIREAAERDPYHRAAGEHDLRLAVPAHRPPHPAAGPNASMRDGPTAPGATPLAAVPVGGVSVSAAGTTTSPGEPDRTREVDPVPSTLSTAAAWAWRVLVLGALAYVLLQIAAVLLQIVVPLLVALLIAALLQPGAGALVRRRWPRALAALTMLLVGLLVVAGIMFLVINRVAANWSRLSSELGQALTRLQGSVVRTFPVSQHQLDQLVGQAQQAIGADQSAVTSGALNTASTVTQVFTEIVLTLIILFFLIKDGRSIWLWLIGLMPPVARGYVDEAGRRSWNTLVSYVRATVVIALIDAVGIGIALVALRVPLALPLAALVFIAAFIPVVGSFIAAIIAVLVALVSNGPVTALIALGAAILVMQLEGNFFSPLLLGRAVRVHPLAVVLSLACGAIVAGVFGALIAVPLVACLNVGGSYLARRHDGPRPPEPQPARARPAVTAS